MTRASFWALVNTDKPLTAVPVRIVGTGNPFPDFGKWLHLATVQQGDSVWHVFTAPRWAKENVDGK